MCVSNCFELSFCAVIFGTCLRTGSHQASANERRCCDYFLLAWFFCLPFALSERDGFFFSSIKLKATGGKRLCFVGLRESCMPLIVPAPF